MKADSFEQLSGDVEADETYIGPKRRHRTRIHHKAPKGKSMGPADYKTPVLGILERDGRMRAWVMPNLQKRTLLPKIYDTVKHGAHMFTDAANHYVTLRDDYVHAIVNHAYEYVSSEGAHVNNIEAFWAVLKRTLGGTYIAPRPWHLDRYLDEQIFRWETRKQKDGQRFPQVVKGADGKRLTWKALIGPSPTWRLKPGRAARSPLYQGPRVKTDEA